MRIPRRLGPAPAAVCGAVFAGTVHGQCVWTEHSAWWPGFYHETTGTYHAGLQRVVAVGYLNTGPLVTAAWNGAAWAELDTDGQSRRDGAAIAYDAARQRLVLFGGYFVSGGTPSYPAETWEWDGATWSLVSTNGPAGRSGAAMAYDEVRHRAVLYGGARTSPTSSSFTDTWEWDGSAWHLVAASDPLRVSGQQFLVYDSGRARVLLYMSSAIAGVARFWDWDGAAWAPRDNPSGVSEMLWLVFDSARNRAVFVGRAGAYGTWDLDTTSMVATQRSSVTSAIPRGLAFDPARAVAVCQDYFSTWEFNGAGTAIPGYFSQFSGGGAFDAGATMTFHAHAEGSPGQYRWRHNNIPLEDGGRVSGATTETLTVTQAAPDDSGWFDAVFSNGCAPLVSQRADVQVGPVSTWGACYANCDNSTVAPVLNVADFTCFLTRYVAGDPRTNCDGGGVPALNVQDFSCFLAKYAAGCP